MPLEIMSSSLCTQQYLCFKSDLVSSFACFLSSLVPTLPQISSKRLHQNNVFVGFYPCQVNRDWRVVHHTQYKHKGRVAYHRNLRLNQYHILYDKSVSLSIYPDYSESCKNPSCRWKLCLPLYVPNSICALRVIQFRVLHVSYRPWYQLYPKYPVNAYIRITCLQGFIPVR